MTTEKKCFYGCKIIAGPSLMKMMMCVNKEGSLTKSDLLIFTIQAPDNGRKNTVRAWVTGYDRITEFGSDGKKFFIRAEGDWGDLEREEALKMACKFSGVYNIETRKGEEIELVTCSVWW